MLVGFCCSPMEEPPVASSLWLVPGQQHRSNGKGACACSTSGGFTSVKTSCGQSSCLFCDGKARQSLPVKRNTTRPFIRIVFSCMYMLIQPATYVHIYSIFGLKCIAYRIIKSFFFIAVCMGRIYFHAL